MYNKSNLGYTVCELKVKRRTYYDCEFGICRRKAREH